MARPDPDLLDPARYPMAISLATRFQDLDPNNHVNNVATATLFEDLRVRFDWGIGVRETMVAVNHTAMIVSLGIEYLGEMFYPAPIMGHVGTLAIGRTSWGVGAILTQEGRVTAAMRSTIVCLLDKRPAPLPEAFRAALEANLIRRAVPVPA